VPDPIQMTDAQRAARRRRRQQQRRRQIRRRRITALAGIVAVIVVIMLATGVFSGSPANAPDQARSANAPAQAREVPSPYFTCTDPSRVGALHVSGNELLDDQNERFMPYGISTYGGMEYGGGDAWKTYQPQVIAQIKAAHQYWHANTVRLQVSEANVFNNGVVKDGLNTSVLKLLCDQVQLVRSEGEEVVISDNTEWPDWTQNLPTARTVAFWKVIGSIFNNQPGISFDLYNEPRIYAPKTTAAHHGIVPTSSPNWIWSAWLHGGDYDGQHYIGEQALIDDVRASHAENVIWVEGPYFDNTLNLAGQYPVHGTNLVWSIHHPTMISRSHWDEEFGYLTRRYPVVDGEWGQYSASRPECRPTSYALVPSYLAYLREHHIGVLGWSLQPGAMIDDPSGTVPANFSVPGETADPADLSQPNQMSSSYACQNGLNQGAGQQLMNEFTQYSKPAN
jgi:hypothetical protein